MLKSRIREDNFDYVEFAAENGAKSPEENEILLEWADETLPYDDGTALTILWGSFCYSLGAFINPLNLNTTDHPDYFSKNNIGGKLEASIDGFSKAFLKEKVDTILPDTTDAANPSYFVTFSVPVTNARIHLTDWAPDQGQESKRWSQINTNIRTFIPEWPGLTEILEQYKEKVSRRHVVNEERLIGGESLAWNVIDKKRGWEVTSDTAQVQTVDPKIARLLAGRMELSYDIIEINFVNNNAATTKEINPFNGFIELNLMVNLTVRCPEKFVQVATWTAKPEEISLHTFALYFSRLANYHWTDPADHKKYNIELPKFISGPSTYRRLRREKLAWMGIQEKDLRTPVDENGLVVNRRGEAIWIPRINPQAFADFAKAEKNLVDTKTGKVSYLAGTPALQNKAITFDPVSQAVFLVYETGNLDTVDLTGANPFTDVFAAKMLATKIPKHILSIIHTKSLQWGSEHNVPEFQIATEFDQESGFYPDQQMANMIHSYEFSIRELSGYDLLDDDFRQAFKNAVFAFRTCFELYVRFAEGVAKFADQGVFEPIKIGQLMHIMPWLILMRKYATNKTVVARCEEAAKNRMAKNSFVAPKLQATAKGNARTESFGLPGLQHYLPHQVGPIREIEDPNAEFVLLGAAPGGGKTVMIYSSAANRIARGFSKRPLIIMPQSLLGQFISEMQERSRGNLTPFLINLSKFHEWRAQGYTLADIRGWVFAQPKGTIFYSDYDFLKWGATELGIHDGIAQVYPIAQWFKSCGFDIIYNDESHYVKNLNSSQSTANSIVTSGAPVVVNSSGSLVNNRAHIDLVGQLAQRHPEALGTTIGYYMDGETQKLDVLKITELRRNITQYARYEQIMDREWAYLMPNTREVAIPVYLTTAQKQLYDKALEGVMNEMLADPKLVALIKKNDPSKDEAIINIMKRYLAKLEVLIGAPDDENMGYKDLLDAMAEEGKWLPKDMVSPKVVKIDDLITLHMQGGTRDYIREGNDDDSPMVVHTPDPNKIIVLSYNKPLSKHFMKHTIHKKICLHYTAEGDRDAILKQFAEDPNIVVLVADMNTMKVGRNLQVASRVIMQQIPYTPGDLDQAIRRAKRPDVPDEQGKQKYNRQVLDINYVICEDTIDVTKTCRLFVKIIEKALVDEDSNPEFKRWRKSPMDDGRKTVDQAISELEMIRMNFAFIKENCTFETLALYADTYASYQRWNQSNYVARRAQMKAEMEKAVGKKLSDREFQMLSFIKNDTKPIPGVKPRTFLDGHVPMVRGVTPYDPHGFGLQPLASVLLAAEMPVEELEESGDPEEAEEDEYVDNTAGKEASFIHQVVFTEYGFGIVQKVLSRTVRIWIPGFGPDVVNLDKTKVYQIGNKAKRLAIAELLARQQKKGLGLNFLAQKPEAPVIPAISIDEVATIEKAIVTKKTLPKIMLQKMPGTKPEPVDLVKPPPEPKSKEDTTPDDNASIELILAMTNGQRALYAFPFSRNPAFSSAAWIKMPVILVAEIVNPKGMTKLVDALCQMFTIPEENREHMLTFSKFYMANKGNMTKVRPANLQVFRQFMIDNKKPPLDPKTEARPYFFVEDGSVFVAVNAQHFPATRKLLGKIPVVHLPNGTSQFVPGMKKFFKMGPFQIHFFKTKIEMGAEIQRLKKAGLEIEDLPNIVKQISKLPS